MPPEPADESKLTRFDLDFPGGTPAELAAAISKAMGKHLNLVIPTEQADAKIMPIKFDNVTVRDVFAAIGLASEHEEAFSSGIGGPAQLTVVKMTFSPCSPDKSPYSDETVWAFRYDRPNKEIVALMVPPKTPPPQICRYFQLAPYLENYSIEDITTAIQTGWKMAKVDPIPQLSFHKETSLLIAVGTEASVNQIPDVLNALRLDRGPAIEKVERLRAEGLEIEAKKAEGWQAKSQEIQKKISEIAARQRASEEIDNGGRRQIRPTPVGTN